MDNQVEECASTVKSEETKGWEDLQVTDLQKLVSQFSLAPSVT